MFTKSLILLTLLNIIFVASIQCENVWLDPLKIHHDEKEYFKHKEAQFGSYLKDKPNAKYIVKANQPCNEIIFENDTLRVSDFEIPGCLMQIDAGANNGINNVPPNAARQKREIFVRDSPYHFTIPSSVGTEKVQPNSYIEMFFRVCSDPGSEVLVFDKNTLKMIFAFKNLGGSYHCNKLQIPDLMYDHSVSDSNQIQVEYRLPKSDFVFSEAAYDFMTPESNKGSRVITYKQATDKNIIFELEITYNELVFKSDPPIILTMPGTQQASYDANMVKTFVIPKKSECTGPKCNLVGIQIEIKQLNLDFTKGDYVLIGPGPRPHFWKNSPSQVVARRITAENPKKIWVHADSAFILVVTHNSLPKLRTMALEFVWKEAATLVEDFINDESSQFLRRNSIQLCFSGGDCTYWQTSLRYDFVDEAVHIFNTYLIEHEKDITTLIGRDSVKLFDMENITFPNANRKEKYCRLNLALSSPFDQSYPLVNGDTLRKMFFDDANSRSVLFGRITVTDCVFQHISLLSILLPIAVLMTVSGVAVFVFWRLQQSVLQSYIRVRS